MCVQFIKYINDFVIFKKAYQSELDVALEQLQREDPSLRVSQNEETGQTILAG